MLALMLFMGDMQLSQLPGRMAMQIGPMAFGVSCQTFYMWHAAQSASIVCRMADNLHTLECNPSEQLQMPKCGDYLRAIWPQHSAVASCPHARASVNLLARF